MKVTSSRLPGLFRAAALRFANVATRSIAETIAILIASTPRITFDIIKVILKVGRDATAAMPICRHPTIFCGFVFTKNSTVKYPCTFGLLLTA